MRALTDAVLQTSAVFACGTKPVQIHFFPSYITFYYFMYNWFHLPLASAASTCPTGLLKYICVQVTQQRNAQRESWGENLSMNSITCIDQQVAWICTIILLSGLKIIAFSSLAYVFITALSMQKWFQSVVFLSLPSFRASCLFFPYHNLR